LTAETIQGRKVFKGGNYSRKYGKCFLKKTMSLLLFYELSFQILPEDQRRLRAIELSVPSTVATFQVKHRNSYGIVTDARVYNIDLNSGRLEITGLELQLGFQIRWGGGRQ
jgi:hypothetical protein